MFSYLSRSRVLNFLALSLLSFFALVGGIAPASAHDALVSSNPAADEVREDAPQEIELVYSGELMKIGNQVRVTNAEGETVTDGDPVIEGTTLTQALTVSDPQADDTYTVTWRVVSSDGHPIQGKYSFSVGEGKDASTSTEKASAEATSTEKSSGAPTVASPTSETGFTPVNIALVVVGSIAVLGVVATVLAKNRKK